MKGDPDVFRSKRLLLGLCFLAVALPGAPALAQSTKGSDLQSVPNTNFGCELAPGINPDPFSAQTFVLMPHGLPSCSWWSTGSAGVAADPRSSQVPSTGIVTKVRIRSGANPAPVRFVVNRIIRAQCCGAAHVSPVFQPQPNQINEFTVNLPVESVRDPANEITWFDYIGVSAASGTGTLPIHASPAALNLDQAFNPQVITSSMTAPELLPTDGVRVSERGAVGFEVLLQYDHVPCPTAPNGQPLARAAQAGCAQRGATPPPTPAPPGTTPAVPPGAAAPASIGAGTLRARGSSVSVPVSCALTVQCRGTLRIRSRGSRPRVLATRNVAVAAGQASRLQIKLTSAGRRLLRRGRRVAAVAQLDMGAAGIVRRDVTLRR